MQIREVPDMTSKTNLRGKNKNGKRKIKGSKNHRKRMKKKRKKRLVAKLRK